MSAMTSQITNVLIVYSTVCSGKINENIKAPRHWPLWGESTVVRWFPTQMATNAEKCSIWCRHHEIFYGCRLWFLWAPFKVFIRLSRNFVRVALHLHPVNWYYLIIYGAILTSETTLLLTRDVSYTCPGMILCMRPANERRRYNVTSSLIGWAHALNGPCLVNCFSGSISYTSALFHI